MIFYKNNDKNKKQYNKPIAREITMIFVDEDGKPPFNSDLRIYSKKNDYDNIETNILSKHLDPMTY